MAEVLNDEKRLERAAVSLRNKIRDKKVLNRLLLQEYETTDEELKQCLIEALIDWNTSPPMIDYVSLGNHPNKALLLDCAAAKALTSAGIWHSREHMPSSDGGTSADDHAKASEYSLWSERLTAEYERKKSDLKTALNISAALGNQSVSSEYAAQLFGMLW